MQWRRGRGSKGTPEILAYWKILLLTENFLRRIIGMKGIFTLRLRKHGWTEQSKVVSQ